VAIFYNERFLVKRLISEMLLMKCQNNIYNQTLNSYVSMLMFRSSVNYNLCSDSPPDYLLIICVFTYLFTHLDSDYFNFDCFKSYFTF